VRECCSRDESRALPDSVSAAQPPSDDAESSNAWFRELEERWRVSVNIAIDEPHLRPDVAAGVACETGDLPRAVIPSQTRQPYAARVSSHNEWSVRGTGDGWKRGGDGVQRSFRAKSGERRQLSLTDGASENIRSHSIGDDHYYLGIIWRASCRRTQL
jgi:hypothetical protein